MKASEVRAREIFKGKRARKTIPYPLEEGPLPLPVLEENGSISYPTAEHVVPVDVRVLTTAEELDARGAARALAKAKGVEEPAEGNDIYDLALMSEVVFRAYVDHDDQEGLSSFFDKGVEQVRELDADRLTYLYEQQLQWQALCSPRRGKLTGPEFISYVTALAVEEEDLPFDPCSLAMQRHSLRSLARLHLSSLTHKLPSESDSSSTHEADTQA